MAFFPTGIGFLRFSLTAFASGRLLAHIIILLLKGRRASRNGYSVHEKLKNCKKKEWQKGDTPATIKGGVLEVNASIKHIFLSNCLIACTRDLGNF